LARRWVRRTAPTSAKWAHEYATNVTSDPLRAEIARLRVPVSMPQRDVMVNGERVPLDPSQYDEYQRTAGSLASQALRPVVSSPQWKALTDTDKGEAIKDAFKSARHDARDALLANHPELGAGSMPAMPSGYSAPGVGRLTQVPSPPVRGVPPLPPGYSMVR
jgi:hypothetical protein